MSRPLDPRLLSAAPRLRRLLAVYAVVQAIGAVLIVAQAVVLAGIITNIVAGRPARELLHHLVILAAVGVARAGLGAVQEWTAARGSVRVRADLRCAVLNAVRRLGPGWANRQPSGRLVTAAGPGLEGMDGYLSRALPALVSAAVIPPVVLAWELRTDWRSGAILVLVLPLVPVFMALVGLTTGRRMQRQYEMLARMSGHFLDLVTGLASLRIYGRAEQQVRTVRAATDSYRRHTMATLRAAFLSSLVLDLVATLSVAVVAVDVGLRLDHRSVGLSTALVVLLLAPELFAPLRAMGAQHHAAEEGRVASQAALDVIAEAAAVRPSPAPACGGGVIGTRLQDVSVTYPGRDRAALDGISLDFREGAIVALHGRSGAGKSTILSLLLGFVRPETGTVAVAGGDPSATRDHVAWVPQRPRPTQATVGAEVALGDPGADADAIAAALLACAAPSADSPLGEDGRQISAGQRRRVALARALLRARRARAGGGCPVVLLDEPSEDLDAATESVVVSVLAELAGYAIVVVASHSPVILATADRVVTLAEGCIVADVTQRPDRARAANAPAASRPRAGEREAGPAPRTRWSSVLPVRRTLRFLLGAGALAGLAGLAGLALTATSIWLLCRAAQHPNVQVLAIAVVGVRTFALGRALTRYLERLVAHDGALRLLADVRARVFAALVPLVPGSAQLRRGDLLRRFVTDVDGVQEGLVRAVVPLVGGAVTAAGAITLAALLVPMAGAALAIGLTVALVLGPALARALAGSGADVAIAARLRDVAVTGLLDGLAELTAYGADGAAVREAVAADEAVIAGSRRMAIGAASGAFVAGLAGALTLPAVLGFATGAAAAGTLSGVTAAALVACVLAGFDALSGVPAACAAWSRCTTGLARVSQLLAERPPMPDSRRPAATPRGRIGLDFADVALAPAPDAPVVVAGLDLTVRPGDRVALIGPSGCGKSTALATALRLLPIHAGAADVTAGMYRAAVADIAPDAMPALAAGSLQGDHVFDATLRDNLRVVRPEATDTELDRVAARAGFTDVVAGLPAGWSTPAGPDGAELSGGQRQRLLLARALLAAPSVLVLDEPTAHLDAETEASVFADLLSATTGQTLLLSTHRAVPAGAIDMTVQLADRDLRPVELGPSLPARIPAEPAGLKTKPMEVSVA